jgi:hypothetical protein
MAAGCTDKARLREWRQDFARMMRDQGIAANATPRAVRGQSKRAGTDAQYRAQRRGNSYALRSQVEAIAREVSTTGRVSDPAHGKLRQTRRAMVSGWMNVADRLDAQGEIVLAGDVRNFAKHLPPVLTDRERLAQSFMRHMQKIASPERRRDLSPERTAERTR